MKNYYCNYIMFQIISYPYFILLWFLLTQSLSVVWMWIIIKNLKSGLLEVAFLLPYLFLSYNSNIACFFILSVICLFYACFKHKIIKIYLPRADLNSFKHNWICTIPIFFLALYLLRRPNSCPLSKQCNLYHPDTRELHSFKESSIS